MLRFVAVPVNLLESDIDQKSEIFLSFGLTIMVSKMFLKPFIRLKTFLGLPFSLYIINCLHRTEVKKTKVPQ
jgi:hypothetical protein